MPFASGITYNNLLVYSVQLVERTVSKTTSMMIDNCDIGKWWWSMINYMIRYQFDDTNKLWNKHQLDSFNIIGLYLNSQGTVWCI